ncbi:MAG: IS66 family transposase [Oligoflexia bacterium]|nr:IS66 family transposase [Oligoflexia bacterium]
MKTNELPNNIDELKKIIIEQRNQIEALNELLSYFKRKYFGKKSEKVSPGQLGLFDEVELEALEPEPDKQPDIEEDDDETILIPAHKRKKRGKRLKLADSLPRVEKIIDIENKNCLEDGADLKCIGEEVSERLEIVPAKVYVLKTIKKKYACPICEDIKTAVIEEELLPKTNASASLLAYISVCKYVDSLPLYRQESIFERIGVTLCRQTMARWMIQIGEKIDPLITLLREELLKSCCIRMDETKVQVLNEEGKKAETNSYMWVQARSGAYPIILFHYAKDRSGKNLNFLLDDYHYALQVDGYDGYARIILENGIIRLGCWAHLRRKFYNAFKSSNGKSIGKQGLIFIKKLYDIEEEIKGKSVEERFYIRLTKSIPIALKFKEWTEEQIKQTTPNSLAGKALHYLVNEWQYLMNCFSNGEYEIDNNYIESHIRPFTIGRKNWLFSVKPEGATASANIYSLVETAKANGLDPFEYLKKVFEKLPQAKTEKDFLELLPIKIQA